MNSTLKKDNKFLSYIILLASLFVLVLVTRGQFAYFQEVSNINEEKNFELQEVRDDLSELNKIKEELTNSDNDFSKYNVEFKEDELIEYFYSYGEAQNINESNVIIKAISFSEGSLNEFGFVESNINLSVLFSSEIAMKNMLDFIISKDSKYRFFITDFSYPNDGRTGTFSVNIPVKMFYKK